MRRAELLALPPLVARQRATQVTADRYNGFLHVWGQVDCIRVAAFHLRQLGHKPHLARGGSYSSEIGAVRALKRAGYDHPKDALAALGLPKIGWASALVGDIFGLRSPGQWPALAVYLGNGRLLTSSEDHPAFGIVPTSGVEVLSCWRVDPCLTR